MMKIQKSNLLKFEEMMKKIILILALIVSGFLSAQLGPGAPNVNAGADVTVDCTNNCADLNATFFDTGETTSYQVQTIPYASSYPAFGGTQVSANIDDRWSPVITLPFTFCFFDVPYTDLIVGSNGVVSFDTGPAGGFCPYSFTQSVPDPALIRNAIFGVYQDIDPSVAVNGATPVINYNTYGTAPNRAFVINFPRVPRYSCNNLLDTSQIVLYEATNVVEVYVRDRNTGCTFNNGNALIGIQNAAGNLGYAPPGRNTGDWQANFEAYRFLPDGPSITSFEWVDATGTVLSTNPMYTHCVTSTETITAQVDYTLCDNSVITVTDDVIIDFPAGSLIDLGADIDSCDDTLPVVLDSGILTPTGTFVWLLNGVVIPGEIAPTLDVTSSGTYEVNYTAAGCVESDTIVVTISPTPVANSVVNLDVCDDASNDGIENFVFSNQNATLLGAQNPADFVITYHASQADADANANALSATGYQNAGTGTETIYARIESVSNNTCFDTTSFDITVNVQPIANTMNDIEVCDDVTNDGFEVFDLTQNEADLLGTQNPTDFNITYHLSQIDADSNSNAIANPTGYTNTTVSNQRIYVRIENAVNNTCYNTEFFDLNISLLPLANPLMNMVVCDDISNDGIENFDFSSQNATLLGAQNTGFFSITYHASQADADANANALSATAYQNAGTGTETIYARIESVSNNTCFDTTSFDITVNVQPIANTMSDIEVCDDVTNDGFEVFDLTQNETDLLGTQNPTDFNITYHTSQSDADANLNAIATPSTFSNTVTPQQTIVVRVESITNSDCYSTGTFNINVSTQPVANQPNDMIVCDDASNDGTATFVLTTQIGAILGVQNPADFAISFHTSQADADSDVAAIALAYDNISSPETVFVRVESLNNPLCVDTTTFDLIVNPLPAVVAPANIELCDDPSGDGVESFDLLSNQTTLLNGVDPTTVTITYHLSQADADAMTGIVFSPYNNTSATETIFVRVEDNVTGCFNVVNYDLVLNGIPAINTAVSDLLECDPENDGIATFNLDDRSTEILNGHSGVSIVFYESLTDATTDVNAITSTYTNVLNPQILGYRLIDDVTGCYSLGAFNIEATPGPTAITPTPLENCANTLGGIASADLNIATAEITAVQNGVTVSYHESQADAENSVNAVSLTYDYTNDLFLFIRVEDNATGCVNFSTVDLVYNDLPLPTLLSQYLICIDSNGVLLDGPAVLDTGLTTVNYTFEWFQDGVAIPGETSGALNATSAGDYEVVITAISSGCVNSQMTNVRQSGIPTDYDVEVTTSTYDVNHQVIATATGPDEYWFRLDDGPYVNSGIFNNVTPGPHSVTISERNGCGEIIVDVFVFGYPDYFTPNNDGFNDTWNIVGGDRLPGTTLYIFDRFGKLLKQLDVTGIGWDGTYNGEPMPSSDYWFKIEYVQDGKTSIANGHFALKR